MIMYNQEGWLRRRQEMTTFFYRYAPPLFGEVAEDLTLDTGVKPPYAKAPSHMCSVYYYWWSFLRQDADYMRRSKREPNLHDRVMRDFGDLDAYGSFEGWWRRVGRKLFSEPAERGIRWASNPDELPRSDGCVYISVPFRFDIDQTLAELRAILKPEMDAQKAQVSLSGARYPVFTKPVLSALHNRLEVLKLREAEDITLSEIGIRLGIGPTGSDAYARNVRETTVGRYLREATSIRKWALRGFFPVVSDKALRAADQKGLLREPGTRVNG
jgi:hypothetical protein